MTKERALEYWINRYNSAKDYSDIHWDAEERHEHRDYIEAMAIAIKALEAADVQPVKRGEWEKKSSVGVFRCSLCQHIFMLGTDEIDEYHFCPHCGADMRNDSNLMKNRS